MTVLQTHFRRLLVHQLDKGRLIARNVLCHDVAGLVCRRDHHAVEHLLERERFALKQAGRAAVFAQPLEGRGRDGEVVLHVAVLDREHTGHDFRQTGRIDLVVDVKLIEDRARAQLEQQTGAAVEREIRLIAEVIELARCFGRGARPVADRLGRLDRVAVGIRLRLGDCVGRRLGRVRRALGGGGRRARVVRRGFADEALRDLRRLLLGKGKRRQTAEQERQCQQQREKSSHKNILQKRRLGLPRAARV